jgi:multidrug efflux pump subunit AcrA (membrane-fusion protein)
VKAGDVLAYVATPMSAAELSDQRQRQGELDQQIALVQQRIARYERLMSTGSVAKVQLDESRVELAGLNDRREALERRQAEALVAPTSGIIAASNAIAGKIAESNAIIFQIASRLYLTLRRLMRACPTGAR